MESEGASVTSTAQDSAPSMPSEVAIQVEEVKAELQENIEKIQRNQEQVKSRQDAPRRMTTAPTDFRHIASGPKGAIWWQNFKFILAIVAIVGIIALIAVGVSFIGSGSGSSGA